MSGLVVSEISRHASLIRFLSMLLPPKHVRASSHGHKAYCKEREWSEIMQICEHVSKEGHEVEVIGSTIDHQARPQHS